MSSSKVGGRPSGRSPPTEEVRECRELNSWGTSSTSVASSRGEMDGNVWSMESWRDSVEWWVAQGAKVWYHSDD